MSTLHPCRACRQLFPAPAMARRAHGRLDTICRSCKRARARACWANTPAREPLAVDPCPTCGVAQAQHWRCRRCGSRGHLTGRSAHALSLCQWCEWDTTRPGWSLTHGGAA